MKIVDVKLAEIAELFLYAVQRTGESVNIHAHTDGIVAFIPVGLLLSCSVELFKFSAAGVIALFECCDKAVEALTVAGIEGQIELFQLIVSILKSEVKFFTHHSLAFSLSFLSSSSAARSALSKLPSRHGSPSIS